jgi:hypothetical protein
VDLVESDDESTDPSVDASLAIASTALTSVDGPAIAELGSMMAAAATARMTICRMLRAVMMRTFLRGQFCSSVRRHRYMSSTT